MPGGKQRKLRPKAAGESSSSAPRQLEQRHPPKSPSKGNEVGLEEAAGFVGGLAAEVLASEEEVGAELLDFGTKSMTTAAGCLKHELHWKSSTGDLADLANIDTRECVEWGPAPKEFGPPGEYSSGGRHNGLGTNKASGGSTVDNHSIIPTGFKLARAEDGESKVWMMKQVYQYRVGSGAWKDIPGARYEITRWFERDGADLVAYAAKRGLTDGATYRALVKVPGWFT